MYDPRSVLYVFARETAVRTQLASGGDRIISNCFGLTVTSRASMLVSVREVVDRWFGAVLSRQTGDV